MYLKKLELFGFKSFADKTELRFEGGVTAIVGPNGVGKSNIAEAIKWVLGEQSARELRGMRMEDVIFNGTETRPPLNFSEVMLTFRNKERILPIDYDEVTITRRVFRTGESQYLLNKTPVRLKDINDLLMGTAVGLDSYSIIGQGKIDLILSSKPEDRRYIFEEAAGITKYKSKKREALRKLEYTENNLLRVNDIIKEVSRQIASIERQAKKATSYKKKFEELKEKEVKAALYSFKNLKDKLSSYSDENQKFREEENVLLEEIEKTNLLLAEAKQKLSEIGENINNLYSKRVNIDAQMENANQQISLNTERISELKKRKETLEEQVQSTQIKLQELNEQISKAKEELSDLEKDKLNKTKEMSQKEKSLKDIDFQIKEAEFSVKECKERIFEISTSESRAKNDLTKILADLHNVRARLKRLRIEKEEVENTIEEIQKKFSSLNIEKDERDKRVGSIKKQREQAIHNIDLRRQALREIEDRIDQLNQKCVACQSQLEYLRDLKKNFEGYQDGVKSILIAKEQNQLPQDGILGPIANLIEIDPSYEKAVEAALGRREQILVVRDLLTVKKCINYLKSHNLGEATFICLESIEEVPNNVNFSDLELMPLLSVVKFNPEFKGVLDDLLGNTYVAKDLEEALVIREKLKNATFKLVTKDGDVVERNLFTCGTRQRKEGSLISREAKIKTLEEDINKYQYEAENLKIAKQKEGEELQSLELTLEDVDSALQEEEINLANVSSRLNSIEEEKRRINDELSLLNLEITEAEEEENKLNARKQQLGQQIEEVNRTSFELESVMTSKEDLIKTRKEEREQLLVSIAQLKTELSSLTDLEINQNQTVKMLEDANSEQQALLNTQKQEIEDSKIRLENIKLEIENTTQKIKALEEERNSTFNELENASKLKEEQLKDIKEIEKLLADKQKELEEIKSSSHNSQVKITELNYQIQSLKDRMFENYKVDLENSQVEIESGFNYEQTKEEISWLKQKLDSMGAVNLVAIEEHKELQERFDFLNNQKKDLEEAKESLHKAITKINKTTKKLFIETFVKIQESFREFFRLLFGGGQAELILIDESDVLESGIEINVRPPGKKLQNISLLSGGEKALTAIALLFAIFKVKPSPFCILDEIDAPLDEANIDRFTKVLQDFLKTSQFIVITHNKKTIGMADVMYGVTMEEAGVSRIVSVKFRDSKEVETAGIAGS